MIETARELAIAAKGVANNYKTIYMKGAFGAPVTESLIKEKTGQYPSWYTAERQKTFRSLIGKGYFAFDCICLVKALLWNWVGDPKKEYGGATYEANGVPDEDTEVMISLCKGVTTDFTAIEVGELLWMKGHVGIYIGDGLAVECTTAWKNCVQITAVHNIGKKTGYNGRKWTKHGKLPYVSYPAEAKPEESVATVKLPVLKRGDKGASVKALQLLLIGNGYRMTDASGKVYGADSSFGGATERAVEAFQSAKKLKEKKEVGAETWAALLGVDV